MSLFHLIWFCWTNSICTYCSFIVIAIDEPISIFSLEVKYLGKEGENPKHTHTRTKAGCPNLQCLFKIYTLECEWSS